MASRADLIMAQVRGELAQLNREKANTGNVIDDITAGVLGYQTGKEIMDSLQDPINKIKTRRAKKNKTALMDKYSGISDIDIPQGGALTGGRSGDNLHTNYGSGIVKEGSLEHEELLKQQQEYDNMDLAIEKTGFDTYEDSVFDKPLPGKPLPKPDRPMVKSMFTEEPEMLPNMMTDEEKLPINMNVKDEINRATELYLGGTLDTYQTDMGTFNTTFNESTGYNYSNVNLSDMPEAQYDLEAVQSAQAGAGVTGFFTGRSQEEITDKQDEIANEAINKLTTG